MDAIAELRIFHNGAFAEGERIVPTTSRSILTTVFNEDDNPATTDHGILVAADICDLSTEEQRSYNELLDIIVNE